MATGGCPDRVFTLPKSKITVTVSSGDIFTTTASSIVVGEDPTFAGHGLVSQTLLKRGSDQFRKNRDKLKSRSIPLLSTLGKVYRCDFPPKVDAQTRDTMHFNVVLYAMVPSYNRADWQKTMKKMYWNVIKEANKEGKKSVAMPVLGSGGAGAPVEKAIDILADALETFQYKKEAAQNLTEIIVYCHQDKAYNYLVHTLETHSSPAESPESSARKRPQSSVMPTGRRETSRSLSNGNEDDHSLSNLAYILSKSGIRDEEENVDTIRSEEKMDTDENDEETKLGQQRMKKTKQQDADEDFEETKRQLTDTKSRLKHMEKTKQQDAGKDFEEAKQQVTDTKSRLKGMEKTKQQDTDKDFEETEQQVIDQSDEDVEEGQDHEEKTKQPEEDDTCAICLDKIDKPKKLEKCGHVFCTECIEDSFRHHKPACPACNTMYGLVTGNQPHGRMDARREHYTHLPGYQNCGTIVIDYDFPNGTQGKEHPNPGHAYIGTQRRAYLPDTKEGQKVYRLLRVAFNNRLTFTIGKSRTTGADNVVTWNDIHHKTNIHGGTTYFGYPDPLYLSRVQEELAAKGITEECLQGQKFDI